MDKTGRPDELELTVVALGAIAAFALLYLIALAAGLL